MGKLGLFTEPNLNCFDFFKPVKMPSSSILSDFEWDEGLTMPVANAENKFLEGEVSVEKLQTKLWENKMQLTCRKPH